MKSSKYKNIEDKFYRGETSPEEERWLKKHSVEPLFEALKDEKDETMDWDFEDFLAKAESPKEVPLPTTNGGSNKIFWLAAAWALICGSMIFYQKYNSGVDQKDRLVKNEVVKQKTGIIQDSTLALSTATDSIEVHKDLLEDSLTEDAGHVNVLDEILPKRGRIKRQSRPVLVKNETLKAKPNELHMAASSDKYDENFVIINGQRIENENEAIDVAKYSLQMLSDNMRKTIAQAHAMESMGME